MEIIALGIVGALVAAALGTKKRDLYDHSKDAKTDIVAHKVAKWFHPDKAELLDAELVGRNIVSVGRSHGVNWADEFDACHDELQAELHRIRGGR